MSKTSDLTNLIRLEASRFGAVLFRNNVGFYKKDGHAIRYGLCVGSSDFIGWLHGRFLAIEIKVGKDKLTPEQINFLEQVNQSGGIGICARSVSDVTDRLNSEQTI